MRQAVHDLFKNYPDGEIYYIRTLPTELLDEPNSLGCVVEIQLLDGSPYPVEKDLLIHVRKLPDGKYSMSSVDD